MGLNDVVIIPSQNGLGRGLPGQDYISGLVFYSDTLPTGFSASGGNIQQVLSLTQAESLGITNTYADETAATGSVVITAAGTAGSTIAIQIQEPTQLVTIGTYTVVTGDTPALVAAGLVANIAVNRNSTGYTAVVASSTDVLITARPGLGLFPNTGTPIEVVTVGSTTHTITQFSGGVPSLSAQWHYHISEYFRVQPQGNLFVGFFPVSGQAWDMNEVYLMQVKASGAIRQIGLYLAGQSPASATAGPSISHLIQTHYSLNQTTVIPSICDLIQAKASLLATLHTPLIAVFATDMSGFTSPDTFAALTTLIDLTTHSDNRVSVTISQDGGATGAAIFAAQGTSITDVGATLGVISLAAVSQDIAWVGGFNMTDGSELATPAYSNGRLVSEIADQNLQLQLQNFSYLFLRTFQGYAGTFQQNSSAAISPASDFAYIENNRTWDKASRLLYAALLPVLGSNITLNSDGTLAATSIAYVSSLATTALEPMVRAVPQELSNFKVIIDPSQNLLSTGTLVVTVQLLPEGVARNIVVNLGFVQSLS